MTQAPLAGVPAETEPRGDRIVGEQRELLGVRRVGAVVGVVVEVFVIMSPS